MKSLARIAAVPLAAALLLTSCETPPSQRDAGMVIGGVLGGLIGHDLGGGHGRTAATILGTLIGATVGGAIGRSMDESDRIKTAHALENVRTGVPSHWVNPDTRSSYTVVPTRTYDSGGQPCREYTIDAVIGGKPDKVYGTACRQADGSWRTVP
jgi:surface antigen